MPPEAASPAFPGGVIPRLGRNRQHHHLAAEYLKRSVGGMDVVHVPYKSGAIAPEIPTMIEAGVPGYEAYTFSQILGPPGMPPDVVDVLDKASRQAMADPTTIKFLEGNASIPTPDTTPERTAKFIKDELAKWAPIIRQRQDRLKHWPCAHFRPDGTAERFPPDRKSL